MPAVTSIRRHPERAVTDRERLDAILDAGWVGTLAVVVHGAPQVVPMLYARVADEVLLHGSTGAGTLRAALSTPVAFCVTHLDAFVYAASLFHSSANYRSAVVTGRLERVDPDRQEAALLALSEHLMPGRATEVRAVSDKELAATLVLRLPIRAGQWTAKVRTGPPGQDPEADPRVWTGLLPLVAAFGAPSSAPPADPGPGRAGPARETPAPGGGIPVSPSVLARLGPPR